MNRIVRITTIPTSLKILLKGQLNFMVQNGLEIIAVSSPGKDLEDVADREGVRVVGIVMTRLISPFRDLWSLICFFYLCKKERPIIVHSHTPKAGIVAMLGSKLAGVPFRIHTVAGLPVMEATGIRRLLMESVERLTYICATRVYPNSKGLYDFILENGYTTKSKLKIIGNGSSNGIDTEYFNPVQISDTEKLKLKEQLGINTDDFVFIFVGRLVGDKGVNELISVFNSSVFNNDSISTVKLILVGPPEPDLDPLEQKTLSALKNNKNIICVGFQSDVRQYYAISDCLVFPSYREGFPNVVMQAGAMGLPSIVTDINGCNEIIIDGINGVLVPSKNEESLMKAMLNMYEMVSLRNSLKMNARKSIVSRYNQKDIWNLILKEYEELISGS